ncbi:MAG TPA: ABC transporter permease subunit [Clostridiaceae bacterium]|jgi:NitT/TauT family transport system permease protein|nr:ABC transporter permease subunit [Clostridiaceae bacterium]
MMSSTILNRNRIEKLASAAFALIVWQISAMLIGESLFIVTPIAVVKRLFSLFTEADFFTSIGYSFLRIVAGFLIGLIAGSLMAAVAGKFHLAEIMFRPFIATIKSVPVASFIILCLIWLSMGTLSSFISFLMVLPIIYSNILQGIKSTDKKLLEMAEVFRVGLFRRIVFIYLPQLKPYLISACSVAMGLAWKSGIAAEVIGVTNGSIGEKLYEAKIYYTTADLFAWTLIIVVLSIGFEKLFLYLIKKFYAGLERL